MISRYLKIKSKPYLASLESVASLIGRALGCSVEGEFWEVELATIKWITNRAKQIFVNSTSISCAPVNFPIPPLGTVVCQKCVTLCCMRCEVLGKTKYLLWRESAKHSQGYRWYEKTTPQIPKERLNHYHNHHFKPKLCSIMYRRLQRLTNQTHGMFSSWAKAQARTPLACNFIESTPRCWCNSRRSHICYEHQVESCSVPRGQFP